MVVPPCSDCLVAGARYHHQQGERAEENRENHKCRLYGYPEHPKMHSLSSLPGQSLATGTHFPSLDRPHHTLKWTLISSISWGNRPFSKIQAAKKAKKETG